MGNEENQRVIDYSVNLGSVNPESRIKILKNIAFTTEAEMKNGFIASRNYVSYLGELGGLVATIGYIRDLGSSNLVVDVGTGQGIGWSQIEEMYGEGLEFLATGLVGYESCYQRFGDRFRVTSAEEMNGFGNNSVGGIIGVASIAYGSPRECIDKLDEILVPGGVIKSKFGTGYSNEYTEFKTHDLFTERLRELNYDIVISDTVVLAIKPGGLVKASELMERDLISIAV